MDKSLERDLINYLYFDLNRLRYFVDDEIFEYDIQSSIHLFLKMKLKNMNLNIKREKGKVDHVIEFYNEQKNIQYSSLIEVKSFIKKHEKFDINKINKDIVKLNDRINLNDEGYLIVALKESHLANSNNDLGSIFSSNKRVYNLIKDNITVKTRIIKSFKTTYSIINEGSIKHKSQIRIYMFQVKNNLKN